MAVRFSTGLRNALLGTASLKDTFADGVIYIYSGSQPATADAAVTGTLLGRVTVNGDPFAFGNVANGLEFDTPADGALPKSTLETWKFTGLAAGTAGWFRLMGNASDDLGSSTSLPRIDGSIGTFGADLNLGTTAIAVDDVHTIDQFTVRIAAN